MDTMNVDLLNEMHVAIRDMIASLAAQGYNYVTVEATYFGQDPDDLHVEFSAGESDLDADPELDLEWIREERFRGILSMDKEKT